MTFLIGHGRYARLTYPRNPAAGGGAAVLAPLSRQRFIDGDTTQLGETGAAAAPFPDIATFIASRTNVSIADATADYVGWLMPALAGYTEAVALPPYASTELRADSFSGSAGAGAAITGNVTWANLLGANAATRADVALVDLRVTGSFVVTDDVAAPPSHVYFGGQVNVPFLSAGFDSSLTTELLTVTFENATVNGDIDCGVAADSAALLIIGGFVASNISARQLIVNGGASLSVATIILNAAGTAAILNTSFVAGSNPVLTCLGGARFDGSSWRSFVEAGGTRAVGTIVLVTGGYNGAPVEGAALTGAATTVSLNGTGATASHQGENSGNHYTTSNGTPTSVTLAVGGGELPGDTILISKTDLGANVLAVINGGPGAGTLGTIPTLERGFVLAQFDGTNWVFAEGGSLAA